MRDKSVRSKCYFVSHSEQFKAIPQTYYDIKTKERIIIVVVLI